MNSSKILGAMAAALAISQAPAVQAADLAGVAGLPGAPPEAVGFSSQRLAALDAAMGRQVTEGRYSGVTTLVVRHGKVVNFATHGAQDIAGGKPLQKDAIFAIASMTKPVTGVALMILYEEGKWQLDDPVAKFLPEIGRMKVMTPTGELVDQAHPMTMRQLITNTAGFPGGSTTRNPKVRALHKAANLQAGTLSDMVAKLGSLPLSFQPGTEFEYGISQDIQGAVIERISGQTLDVFMKTRIFDPLGMKDTGFGVARDKRSRLATIYSYGPKGELVPMTTTFGHVPGEQPKYLSGAGGLYSTAEDYLRLSAMLLGGGEFNGVRILSPSSVKLMASDMMPDGVHEHYSTVIAGVGNGVDLAVVLDPARASFTGGAEGVGSYYWAGRFGTWWWNDPMNDLIVIGMAQQDGAAEAYVGNPTPAPDLRALSQSIIYGALVEPQK